MRELLTDPLCRPEHLGEPIPDSPHAVSVTMPTWDSVVGYEEQDAEIHRALQCGYPRFFCHPVVRRLFEVATERYGGPGEAALVLGSREACGRCARFLEVSAAQEHGASSDEVRVLDWPGSEVGVVVFPERFRDAALRYWRYTGEMVSSRHAEALLKTDGVAEEERDVGLERKVLARLASWSGQDPECGRLFTSGMAAIYAAFRAATHEGEPGRTIQLEFPYVDVFCIQKHLGAGGILLHGESVLDDLSVRLRSENIRAVFCEIPCNPLTRTVDLPEVYKLCREASVPLIVDDTLGTVANVDVYPHADIVTTSLTKSVSGGGDVMAGALWVCDGSPMAERFQRFFERDRSASLFKGDTAVLWQNSEDFPERMAVINRHGEALAEFLAGRSEVEHVYYPNRETPEHYEKLRRPDGGYGGLLSIDLHGGEVEARAFYDALAVSKGPSLGTNFTLACPYTLLAHYEELEWAESCGVSRYLIRVAVGMEPIDDLRRRFEAAFEAIA